MDCWVILKLFETNITELSINPNLAQLKDRIGQQEARKFNTSLF